MPSEASQRIRATFTTSEAPSDVPIEIQRQQWEEAAAQAPLPPGLLVDSLTIGTIACERVYAMPVDHDKMLVWLHGGGFNAGSCVTHRELAARLSRAANMPVLLVDYRLAPEHPFPAAIEDASMVYRWLLANEYSPNQIAIGGDSAGAAVALSALVSLRDADEPMPSAVVLLSPWLDLALAGTTMSSRSHLDPMVTRSALLAAVDYYIGDRNPHDPLVSPIYAELPGLPPLLIHVGDHEILLSDATRLADRAEAAGVQVMLHVWPEMWHVFPTFAGELPEGQQVLDQIGAYLRTSMAS